MKSLTVQSDFDYSLVGNDTASELKRLSNQLDGIYQNYSVAVGEVLYQAQQELSSYDGGTFQKWVESKGISKSNAYNYINNYRLVQNLDNPQEKEIFLSQPKSLQYEMSKPSALPEVNQAVFDGDITTHKAYKELERKLKLQEQITNDLTDENSRLKSATVEVREVVREIVPADYSEALRLSENLSERVKAAEERNTFLEGQLATLKVQRATVDEKSAKYDELTKAIEQSQGELNSYQRKIAAYKNILSLIQKGNEFLLSMGGLIYADEEKVLRADGIAGDEFDSFVSRGLRFFSDLDQIRNTNHQIVEGEIV